MHLPVCQSNVSWFPVGDVCFGDQSPCTADSYLLTATGLLLSKGTFLREAQAWRRNPCHRTSILPHTSYWEDFKLNCKQITLEMPSRRANGWRVWKGGFVLFLVGLGFFKLLLEPRILWVWYASPPDTLAVDSKILNAVRWLLSDSLQVLMARHAVLNQQEAKNAETIKSRFNTNLHSHLHCSTCILTSTLQLQLAFLL